VTSWSLTWLHPVVWRTNQGPATNVIRFPTWETAFGREKSEHEREQIVVGELWALTDELVVTVGGQLSRAAQLPSGRPTIHNYSLLR
jgi:hypothetical protein